MSQRRMFSNRIANSAKFLQMPAESQLLYFHLVLRADDDGVVESYPILKLLGLAPDNFRVLLAKGFIRLLNEDQVIVIPDWLEHNKIRPDRKVNSMYLSLLKEKYPKIPILLPEARKDVKDNTKRLGGRSTVSKGEDRLGKYRLEEESNSSSKFSSKGKPYFRGEEMRWKSNKWWVLPSDGGSWLEYAGSKEEIDWK